MKNLSPEYASSEPRDAGNPPCLLCHAASADHSSLVHDCPAAAAMSARRDIINVVPLCAMPQALTMASADSSQLNRVAILCKRLLGSARIQQYQVQQRDLMATRREMPL